MYAKINNGEVEKFPIYDLHAELPGCSLPAILTANNLPDGYVEVVSTIPEAQKFHTVRAIENPVLINGIWTQTWEYLPLSVADAMAVLKGSLEPKRRQIQTIGLSYSFPDGITGIVQTRNEQDLLNVNGQVTAAILLSQSGVTDPVMEFRDDENRTHNLTPAQVIQMGMAVSTFVSATYKAKWTHEAAILNLTTFADLVDYDLSTGWPS